MAEALKLGFQGFSTPPKGVLIVLCEEGLKLGPATRKMLGATGDLLQRAASADRFSGKSGSALDIVAPASLPVARLIVMGIGKAGKFKTQDFVKLGGAAMGRVPSSAAAATIVAETATGAIKPEQVAEIAVWRDAARLPVRPLQDQAQGRRGAAGRHQPHDRGRQSGGSEQGVGDARRVERGRAARARPHQRTGQRALSRRVRAARHRVEEARRRRSRCSTSRR